VRNLLALAGISVLAAGASALDAPPAEAHCSVFNRHPCLPIMCSVFAPRSCLPETNYWIGQDLRLTIESASAVGPPPGAGGGDDPGAGSHKLDTLRAMFDALRACWVPPGADEARSGMQMSVRFAFKRSGDIIATPRVTYVSPDASPEARAAYLHAITATLERCTPLPFSDGLGGAVAGRPIAIRFVDNRDQP
jgi:hypothetical protein